MSLPREAEIVSRLVDEHGYPPHGAELMAGKISELGPEFQDAFLKWWGTGELPPMEVEGYTPERLMKENSLQPLGALLTLDWLAREPEAAKEAVARGHDRVEVTPPAKPA